MVSPGKHPFAWIAGYGSWALLGPAFLIGLGRGFIVPVMPVIARDEFRISAAGATFVFAAVSVGMLLSTLPTGYLLDRLGRRRILIAAPLLLVFSSLMIFRAVAYWELVLYLALNGFALQMWMLGRLTTVADTGKTHERGRMITGLSGMQRIGLLTGPFIGGLVGTHIDLRAPFLLFAVASLISAWVMHRYVAESSPDHQKGSPTRAEREKDEPRLPWQSLVTPRAVTVFAAHFLSNMARSGMSGQTGPALIFAAYAYGLSAAGLGTISLVVGLITVPVTFLNGQIIDRFGRKRAFVPAGRCLAAALLGFAAIALWQWPLWAFMLAFASGNIALAFMAGTLQTISSDIAPAADRGRFLGISRLTVSGGTLATPLVYAASLAALAPAIGYTVSFGLFGLAALGSSTIIRRAAGIK